MAPFLLDHPVCAFSLRCIADKLLSRIELTRSMLRSNGAITDNGHISRVCVYTATLLFSFNPVSQKMKNNSFSHFVYIEKDEKQSLNHIFNCQLNAKAEKWNKMLFFFSFP